MSDHYDVLVLGTGVRESVLSAALSRAGKRVLHVDPHTYYGNEWASLTLSELSQWASAHANADISFPREPCEPGAIPETYKSVDRHYSIALRPVLLPARGPMIEALIRSNVASYATFRLLGRIGVWDGEHLERVPKSKSDIFRDRRISLADKRKLMRFLQSAVEPDAPLPDSSVSVSRYLTETMGLGQQLERAVTYGVALCWDAMESSASAIDRTRRSLRGLGRYGDAAFLVGQFGGAGELAQGFCRASAVHGGVFILGHEVLSLKHACDSNNAWTLRVAGIEETFTADQVAAPREFMCENASWEDEQAMKSLSDTSSLLSSPVYEHVAVVITDAPIDWAAHMPLDDDEVAPETALVVFPPDAFGPSSNEHAVIVLGQGEGTFACPKGQYVYYLSTYGPTGTSARTCLHRAVRRLHTLLTTEAPFIAEFYCSHTLSETREASIPAYVDTSAQLVRTAGGPVGRTSLCIGDDASQVRAQQAVPNLTETLDLSVEAAEQAFWRLVGEQHKQAAYQAAHDRSHQHDPSEYQGRGGVEPEAPKEATVVEVEFFAPRPTEDDEAV